MSYFFMGIDPGKYGAVALGNKDLTEIYLEHCPASIVEMAKLITQLTKGRQVLFCCLENVWAFGHTDRKEGVTSAFKFGKNFGAWQGVLAAQGINTILTTPQKWQKYSLMSARGKTVKHKSFNKAKMLYPALLKNITNDNGKADALHILRYAIMIYKNPALAR